MLTVNSDEWRQDGRTQKPWENKAVSPSGGSGGFWNQGFLAAAGLPWSLGIKSIFVSLHVALTNVRAFTHARNCAVLSDLPLLPRRCRQ